MEEKGSLGIFLSSEKAVAIWASPDASIRHKLVVTPDADEPVAMAMQAARAVIRQGFAFDEVFIAAGCSSYTQYNLHSEFEDYRQIESTIKFDAEEAAAADAMNLAVTFEVSGADGTGSQVTVYTAGRQLLTDMLMDLQEGGLDPTLIEPDVVCLARALEQTSNFAQRCDTLFIVLSGNNCYMLSPDEKYAPAVRTFLLPAAKDVTHVLVREILLATASGSTERALAAITLIDPVDRVNAEMLAERTGLEISVESPEQKLAQTLASDAEMTCGQLLIAYGASLADRPRIRYADFRRDFMPYQGKRKVMEGSLRLIAISLTLLLVGIAGFFQLKAFRMNRYSRQLEDKMMQQYKAVMYGKTPTKGASPITILKRDYAQAQRDKEGAGGGDSKSPPAKLTFFFEVVNKLPQKIDVKVQQIKVTEKTMTVKGDTNARSSSRALIDAIKKHPAITVGSEQLRQDGNRDGFDITIDPKTK